MSKFNSITSSLQSFSEQIVKMFNKGIGKDNLEEKLSVQLVPVGGTTGQKLTKVSDADNDVTWETPSGDVANVTTSIANHAITDIFESNGTTVKNATAAANATTAGGKTPAVTPAADNIIVIGADNSRVNGQLYRGSTAPSTSATQILNYNGEIRATKITGATYN